MPSTTRVVTVDRNEPDLAVLAEAGEILRAGGLVAFATETVYGLGADATNPHAVRKIFEAKGRPEFNPLIVHAADLAMAQACVADWSEQARLLAEAYWPGPLTLVLPRAGTIPDVVTAGLETVAVRVPKPAVARGLIAAAGCPIAAPSANRSSGISPTLASHVEDDLRGRVELILDSGQTTIGLESTVLDLTTREPRILRPGPIALEALEHHLGRLRVRNAADLAPHEQPVSPGQLPVHYAPHTPAVRVDSTSDLTRLKWPARAALVVIGPHDPPPVPVPIYQQYDLETPARAARDLYVVLRQCDQLGADLIVIVPPPDRVEWRAVRDRVLRATQPADLPASAGGGSV